MGPALFLDKSTLQSLSFEELALLRRHFNVPTVPVAAMEILADLKKPARERPSEEVVMRLADKLLPSQSVMVVHCRTLLEADLCGHAIEMGHRPYVDQGRQVRHEDGTTGYIRQPSREEKAIERWRKGEFTEAEELLAAQWRESSSGRNLDSLKNALASNAMPDEPISTMEAAKAHADALLAVEPGGSDLVRLAIGLGGLSSGAANRTWFRWATTGSRSLQELAPYAYYFLRVNYIFFVALGAGLVTTRGTNAIDLEYLFYLPFHEVFASSDKFHETMTPCLLTRGQMFIPGSRLKRDLTEQVDRWKSMTTVEQDNEMRRFRTQPIDEGSYIYEIWKTCRPNWTPTEIRPVETTVEEQQELLDRMKRYQEAPDSEGDISEGESDFMMTSHLMHFDEPCFCGSLRPFGECCGKDLGESQASSP